jgi:hypothetical protein
LFSGLIRIHGSVAGPHAMMDAISTHAQVVVNPRCTSTCERNENPLPHMLRV